MAMFLCCGSGDPVAEMVTDRHGGGVGVGRCDDLRDRGIGNPKTVDARHRTLWCERRAAPVTHGDCAGTVAGGAGPPSLRP
ncbi:MAG: hypothetical protein RIB61_11480 [Roseicyclus sp.]